MAFFEIVWPNLDIFFDPPPLNSPKTPLPRIFD
jgi:hypothetical protein